MSEVDQFDVEAEAVDFRAFNDGPADAHAKGFEATLRVPKWQPGGQPHDYIEDSTALLAAPGLMHSNQAAVESAGAEREIAFAARDWLNQFWRFSNGRGEIGVREQHNVRARRQQPHSNAITLAAILFVPNHLGIEVARVRQTAFR